MLGWDQCLEIGSICFTTLGHSGMVHMYIFKVLYMWTQSSWFSSCIKLVVQLMLLLFLLNLIMMYVLPHNCSCTEWPLSTRKKNP